MKLFFFVTLQSKVGGAAFLPHNNVLHYCRLMMLGIPAAPLVFIFDYLL